MIVYPDDISMFRDTDIRGSEIVADYLGGLSLEEYVEAVVLASMTQFEFLQLLSDQELENTFELDEKLEDDVIFAELCPNVPAGKERQYRRSLRRAFRMFERVQEVDLKHPQTQGFVQLLEGVGLLGAGRADQIRAGQAPEV
jgi:hypothetical protein